jgi:hypothetical protein
MVTNLGSVVRRARTERLTRTWLQDGGTRWTWPGLTSVAHAAGRDRVRLRLGAHLRLGRAEQPAGRDVGGHRRHHARAGPPGVARARRAVHGSTVGCSSAQAVLARVYLGDLPSTAGKRS